MGYGVQPTYYLPSYKPRYAQPTLAKDQSENANTSALNLRSNDSLVKNNEVQVGYRNYRSHQTTVGITGVQSKLASRN